MGSREDSVDVIERKPIYQGFLRLVRYRVRLSVPSVALNEVLYRECIEGLRAAAVLPFDPATQRIILVKQFRIGGLGAPEGPWRLEPPGGVVDPGESPEEAARREAWEEAGCAVQDLVPILSCHTSPGVSDERVDLFCGRVDSRSVAVRGGKHGEDEWTEVLTLDLDSAIRDIGSGMLTAATLIIAVQWLALNRQRLRERWGQGEVAT